MSVRGWVTRVAWEDQQTAITADATAGATTLEVDFIDMLDPDGGTLLINEVEVDYDDIDTEADTVSLADPLAADVLADTPALIVDGGQVATDYIADVDVGDGDLVPVSIPFEQRALWPEGDYDPPVPVLISDDQETIEQVPGRTPVVAGAFVDVDSLPPVPLTDGLAPDNAPTVTFIGGIGSVFFRWTEVTNADPVTYRLHVRAGSAPTTDGTYEVAAGVGLTFAAVRKLKDGTAVVGDGSVTYYGIVTVEDDDGPGPASTAVSGIPAQVNHEDIAANSITSDELAANSVIAGKIAVGAVTADKIGTGTLAATTVITAGTAGGKRVAMDASGTPAFEAYDSTNAQTVNIDGVLNYIRGTLGTAASGSRVEIGPGVAGNYPSNEARLYTGEANEVDPGLLRAYSVVPGTVDAMAVVNLRAPGWTNPPGGTEYKPELVLQTHRESGVTSQAILKAGQVTIDADSGSVVLSAPGGVQATMGFGSVGTGTFRDSVDARVSAVAPTVTMTTGSVGTGAFRTSVDARVTTLTPAIVVGSDTWHTVTSFTNTWTDRGAANHPPVSYRKNGVGDVRLRGHLSVGGASGTSAFNLPAGWRPDFEIGRLAVGTNQLGSPAYLDILQGGNIEVRYPAGTTFVALNGVTFSTA